MARNRKKQPFLFIIVPPKENEISCADSIIQQPVNINKVLFKLSCLNSYVSSPDWFLCPYNLSPSFFFFWKSPKRWSHELPKSSPHPLLLFSWVPCSAHKPQGILTIAPVNGTLHKTSESIRRWKECPAPQIQAAFIHPTNNTLATMPLSSPALARVRIFA